MRKDERKIAIVLAVILGFFLLFSQLFVTAEVNHECTGENCAICQIVESCEEVLKNLASVAKSSAQAVAICFAIVAVILLNSKIYRTSTPVTLKTKISD